MFVFARLLISRKSLRSGADLIVSARAVSEGDALLFSQPASKLSTGCHQEIRLAPSHFSTPSACPIHERTSRLSSRHIRKQSPSFFHQPPSITFPLHNTLSKTTTTLSKMSYPSTTSSLQTYRGSSDEDDDVTLRANRTRSDPFMAYSPSTPQADPPRAYDAPINYYNDDDLERGHRRSRSEAELSLLRHLRPLGSEYGSEDIHYISPRSGYLRRQGWWECEEIRTVDDWTACIGIWSLAILTGIVIVGGVTVIWISVTQ